jgi:adenylate kinase family enzyme
MSLAQQPARVLIVGTSGAGKTTLARALAQRLGARHIELDALHWGPNWSPREQFVADVQAAADHKHWVCDGNYSAARAVLWPRATHVVWLNYPRRVVWWRVFWRTLARGALRQRLWAGNRESLANAFFSADSILWWSLSTFGNNRAKYAALSRDPQWQHLRWLTLRHPRDAARWLASLPTAAHTGQA